MSSQPDDAPARPRLRVRLWRIARWFLLVVVVLVVAVTAASFGYNAATDSPPARPAGLLQWQPPGVDPGRAQGRAQRAALRVVDVPDQPVLAERQPQQRRPVRVNQQVAEETGAGAQRRRVPVEEHHFAPRPRPAVYRREPNDRRAA